MTTQMVICLAFFTVTLAQQNIKTCKFFTDCKCGSSNDTYRFCNNNRSNSEDFCKRFTRCSSKADPTSPYVVCPEATENNDCKKGITRNKPETLNNVNGRMSLSKRYRRSDSRNKKEYTGRSLAFCRDPGIDPNGERTPMKPMSPRGFIQGDNLEYFCSEGYILKGEEELYCLSTGKWSSNIPTCEPEISSASSCKDPGLIMNGIVTPIRTTNGVLQEVEPGPKYPIGTQLYYSCFDGYLLQGDSLLVCAEYGRWSAQPPTCFPKCGVSFADAIPTGPTLVEMNGTDEWPWTVILAAKSNADIACTGGLIDHNTVLTAASRVSYFKTYFLYFGRLQRNISSEDADLNIRVSTEIILHPKFNNSIRFENDIALVKFAPEVRYTEKILPICLPTKESTEKNIRPGNIGYVAGLGYLSARWESKKLVFAQVPVLSTEDCEQFSRYNNFNFTGDFFCVGSPTETYSATCVDAGSSLAFYDSENDIYTLEGVVTHFYCRMNIMLRIPMWIPKGSYLGMVKVQSFLPWIIENISN